MSDGLPLEALYILRESGITYGIRRAATEGAYVVAVTDGVRTAMVKVRGDAVWAATKSGLASAAAVDALVRAAALNARADLELQKPLREQFR